jgi:hypothetical protein
VGSQACGKLIEERRRVRRERLEVWRRQARGGEAQCRTVRADTAEHKGVHPGSKEADAVDGWTEQRRFFELLQTAAQQMQHLQQQMQCRVGLIRQSSQSLTNLST